MKPFAQESEMGFLSIKNPYKEATKKFLVANGLLGEEVDRGKIMRELAVKQNTVYNVVGELAHMGYSLAIHQKAKTSTTSTTSTTTSTTSSTPRAPKGFAGCFPPNSSPSNSP